MCVYKLLPDIFIKSTFVCLCCEKVINRSLLPKIRDHTDLSEAKMFQTEAALYVCSSVLQFSMLPSISPVKGGQDVGTYEFHVVA